MTVLVLLGPRATEPLEVARRVVSGRDLTALVDVDSLARSLAGVGGLDEESRTVLAVDMATGIADRLAADSLDVVIAQAAPYRWAAAYREGLLLLDRVTMVALTADADRLLLREIGRGVPFATFGAWRAWRASLAELVASKPSFTDFDLILDCAQRSRDDLARLVTAAL